MLPVETAALAPPPSTVGDSWRAPFRGLLGVAFVIAWLCALVPIWSVRLLPLLDQPNHLGLIALWHRLSDPSWRYGDFYAYARFPVPYWGYYFPVHWLSYVFPVEVANKLYLSAYALALPSSVAYFAARFGRSPLLAFLTFPLIYNFSFSHGFLSFCAGLPACLCGVVLVDKFVESPSPRRFAAMVVMTLVTFFMHVVPWLLLGVCALVVLLAHATARNAPWKTLAIASAGLLSTVIVALADLRLAAHNQMLTSTSFALTGRWEQLTELIFHLPKRLITIWPGESDEQFLVAMVVAWVVLAATARSRFVEPAADLEARHGLRDWIPELCFAVAAIGYLTFPFRTYKPLDWWIISPRLAAPAALFGALLIRGSIEGRRRLLLVPAILIAFAYPIVVARHYRSFNERAAGFLSVMQKVPRGSSTLTLMLGQNDDPELDPEVVPFQEFHSYAQLLGGGFNPFQTNPGFPVVPIPGKKLPAPPWNSPAQFDFASMGPLYDFVLTRNEPRDGSLLGAWAGKVPLVAKDGAWRLYATKGVK